jgi:MGT family glycosyltransferase
MARVLFLNQPQVGHLNTLLSIAKEMQGQGHAVHFLIPGLAAPKTHVQILDTATAIPETIRKNGLTVDLLRPSLGVIWSSLWLPFKTGYAEVRHAIGIMAKGVAPFGRGILDFVWRDPPDVMVTDFALAGAALAAEAAQIPYAVIYHSGLPFRGPGVPPFGSGLPIGAGPEATAAYERREAPLLADLDARVNAARGRLGLAPTAQDVLRRPYSPWLNLIASVAAAEAPRDNLTPCTWFVGPCFGKRQAQGEFPYDRLAANRFKVYVSLGTVFNNKPAVFRKILEGLDAPEYQVIVSAGGAYAALKRGPLPANALVFERVPQVELLPRVDLFISHGGNNSINEALAAGKPILVLPIGGEQGDNASRMVYLGVGDRLDLATFAPAQLRAAVDRLRQTPTYRDRAAQLQAAIAKTRGLETASHCIAWLARHRAPLNRPEGLPVTLTPEGAKQLFKEQPSPAVARN